MTSVVDYIQSHEHRQGKSVDLRNALSDTLKTLHCACWGKLTKRHLSWLLCLQFVCVCCFCTQCIQRELILLHVCVCVCYFQLLQYDNEPKLVPELRELPLEFQPRWVLCLWYAYLQSYPVCAKNCFIPRVASVHIHSQ